tara:strand:+ start:3171 stop:3386 length:216 start_codon:yes stop_codon:yes gene_type:complete
MPIEDKQKARNYFYDSKGSTDYSATMSFEEFFSRVWPGIKGKAEGGVSLQFDEGEVAETMFRGGAGFKGHF